MGSTSTKTIKGHKYLYYTCYENGKRVERYCGRASEQAARSMAKKFELEDLERRKAGLVRQIASKKKRGTA